MDLRWGWLSLVLVLTAAGWAGYAWTTWRREQRPADGLLVANIARIRSLPRYRAVVRREFVQSALGVVAAAVLILGSLLLAGRPTGEATERGPARPGDLLLCLEGSPAMYDENVRVLGRAASLLEQLEDERVGLVWFSDAPVTVLPLTDDYAIARQRLHELQLGFRNLAADTGPATSVARSGDGLVSCTDAFDRPDDERGRAVVLATSGSVGAGALYGLLEAGQVAADRDVVVYGVAPAGGARQADLRQIATLTGGRVFDGAGSSATRAMTRILREERDRLVPPETTVQTDRPLAGSLLVLGGLGLVLFAGVRWPR